MTNWKERVQDRAAVLAVCGQNYNMVVMSEDEKKIMGRYESEQCISFRQIPRIHDFSSKR